MNHKVRLFNKIFSICFSQYLSFYSTPLVYAQNKTTLVNEHVKQSAFVEYCENKANKNEDARYTLHLILEKVGSHDCKLAFEKLEKIESLDLMEKRIINIEPIALLENIKSLNLWGNMISDISPIISMSKLESLNLGDNSIEGIEALAVLVDLKKLWLDDNLISDFSAISNLKRLDVVSTKNNESTSTLPFASMNSSSSVHN